MSALAPLIPLGLGCELLGGTDWGHVDVEQAVAAVRCAWESGVEVFDTADAYGLGLSESRLSHALGDARHDATIVSKFGVRWEESHGRSRTWRDNSPGYLTTALERSLRRLRIERIPVYLVHWPDGKTPVEDVLAALSAQVQRGKIGAFGLSNFDTGTIMASANAGASVTQFPLSLVDQDRRPDVVSCATRGIATVAYGVLAQGLLTGKYDHTTSFPADDRRHRLPHFTTGFMKSRGVLLAQLREVAERLGAQCSEVALAWAIRQGVDVALFGARSPNHVVSALRAAQLASAPEAADLVGALAVWSDGDHLLESGFDTEQERGQ